MPASIEGRFFSRLFSQPFSLHIFLQTAGVLDSATGITVYAPDGWSGYHPLSAVADPKLYPVMEPYLAAAATTEDDSDSVCFITALFSFQ